ncbi:MAG: hypoxanthine phosphoribosyltransferase [Ruminococcaceae bacterium]|nr:hypoxanthine phosphoribosyltransferase [Oscillospiraceae bacterium]
MIRDVERILLNEKDLEKIVEDLGARITNEYKDSDKPLVVIVILKGSLIFASDLIRRIELPLEIEFMKVSSYGAGTKNSGEIKIHLDLHREHLEDYNILIIEDIVDSGRTLSRLTQLLRNRNANNVKTCTLLDKPSRREVEFEADFCGYSIPDEFVIGYGLDFDEKYRNLPFVGVLKPEIYS